MHKSILYDDGKQKCIECSTLWLCFCVLVVRGSCFGVQRSAVKCSLVVLVDATSVSIAA